MYHDARCPAKGVRIDGVPGPKIHGLSMSQAAARRRLDANLYERPADGHRVRFHGEGVFGPHKAGGPVGLGIPSIGRTISLEKPLPTRNLPGVPRTPGKKSYTGRCSKAPANPIFQGKIPSNKTIDDKHAAKVFERLKSVHKGLMSYKGNKPDMAPRLRYARERQTFVMNYPKYRARVEAMELAHAQTL